MSSCTANVYRLTWSFHPSKLEAEIRSSVKLGCASYAHCKHENTVGQSVFVFGNLFFEAEFFNIEEEFSYYGGGFSYY